MWLAPGSKLVCSPINCPEQEGCGSFYGRGFRGKGRLGIEGFCFPRIRRQSLKRSRRRCLTGLLQSACQCPARNAQSISVYYAHPHSRPTLQAALPGNCFSCLRTDIENSRKRLSSEPRDAYLLIINMFLQLSLQEDEANFQESFLRRGGTGDQSRSSSETLNIPPATQRSGCGSVNVSDWDGWTLRVSVWLVYSWIAGSLRRSPNLSLTPTLAAHKSPAMFRWRGKSFKSRSCSNHLHRFAHLARKSALNFSSTLKPPKPHKNRDLPYAVNSFTLAAQADIWHSWLRCSLSLGFKVVQGSGFQVRI